MIAFGKAGLPGIMDGNNIFIPQYELYPILSQNLIDNGWNQVDGFTDVDWTSLLGQQPGNYDFMDIE